MSTQIGADNHDAVAAAAPASEEKPWGSVGKLVSLLSTRNRINAAILFLMMLTGAFLEVLGLAAVPAFVSAVIDREAMRNLPFIGDWLADVSAGLTANELVLSGAGVLLAIFAVKNGFLAFNYWLQIRYVTNRRMEIAGRLMRAYMAAPYSFFLTRNTSELLRNVDNEVITICYNVMSTLLELCTKMIILIAVLAFLMVVEPWITLAWIVFLGSIAAIGVRSISGKLRRYGLIQQSNRADFNQSLYQAFGGIKEIRTMGRERYFTNRVMGTVANIAMVNRFKMFVQKVITPASEMAAMTGLLLLAAALVLMGRESESILVTLSLFIVGLVRLREASSAMIHQFADLRYSLVSVEPIYHDLNLLKTPSIAEDVDGHVTRIRPRRTIELRDVYHRYEGKQDYALANISLTIPVGSAVGLVGSTGAGKSTMVDILLGLLDPERGALAVDGDKLQGDAVRRWRDNVGYVPQAIYLLDDTIRRNIALGIEDDDIDEEQLERAIEMAQLREYVEKLPAGLETMIGEGGVRISGGERQRIGIARALYGDPAVIILDEATSALDNVTERAVMLAVEAIRETRTVIMIAHRLTTVKNCDRLYYLKDGRIDAAGSYDELRRSHADFENMAA